MKKLQCIFCLLSVLLLSLLFGACDVLDETSEETTESSSSTTGSSTSSSSASMTIPTKFMNTIPLSILGMGESSESTAAYLKALGTGSLLRSETEESGSTTYDVYALSQYVAAINIISITMGNALNLAMVQEYVNANDLSPSSTEYTDISVTATAEINEIYCDMIEALGMGSVTESIEGQTVTINSFTYSKSTEADYDYSVYMIPTDIEQTGGTYPQEITISWSTSGNTRLEVQGAVSSVSENEETGETTETYEYNHIVCEYNATEDETSIVYYASGSPTYLKMKSGTTGTYMQAIMDTISGELDSYADDNGGVTYVYDSEGNYSMSYAFDESLTTSEVSSGSEYSSYASGAKAVLDQITSMDYETESEYSASL